MMIITPPVSGSISLQRGVELSKSIGLVAMTNIIDLDETGAVTIIIISTDQV